MRRMRLPVSRLLSMLLGIALATSPVAPAVAHASGSEPPEAASLPGEESEQAKDLNTQAQSQFDRGDLPGAAKTYSRILEVLTENKVNRAERDNNLLISLEVYREAFRQGRAGGQELNEAIELLRQGVRVYDAYVAEYQRVYGGGAEPSLEARESGEEIKRMLAEAEKELGPTAPPPPDVKKPKKEVKLTPIDVPRGPSGVGLIVGGAVTMAAGLGTIALIIVGAQRTKEAKQERDDAETQNELEDADKKGNSGETLVIVGAVLTGVLLAGGATMLGLGIRRRVRYMAFSPQVGRGYVGVGLQTRF